MGKFRLRACLSLNCFNRISQIVWLISNKKFLTVLEAGKSKIKVLADLVSGDGLLPGL